MSTTEFNENASLGIIKRLAVQENLLINRLLEDEEMRITILHLIDASVNVGREVTFAPVLEHFQQIGNEQITGNDVQNIIMSIVNPHVV